MQPRSVRDRLAQSTIWRSFEILSHSDKQRVGSLVFLHMSIGLLDLFGVLAIGLLGALSVTGIQSKDPADRVSEVLKFLHISDATFQTQVTIISIIALVLLISRTVLSIYITKRILYFLSRKGATVSANLISRLLAQPILIVQSKTSQETLYALTSGVVVITLGILASCAVFISDFVLLVIIAIGLFVVDPVTALGTFSFFALISGFLYYQMHLKAQSLGLEIAKLNIDSNQKIIEVLSSYRESIVRNRRDYYAREIGKVRFKLANANAEINFMSYLSKYTIEASVIVGGLFISGIQFVLEDAIQAAATLAIFLAAGTRIAPAFLRLQQGSITIRGAIGQAIPTLDLIDNLGSATLLESVNDSIVTSHEGFSPDIHVADVSLVYPGSSTPAISNINFKVESGSCIAIVGSSGAGKSTLVDVLLGILKPDRGSVLISGMSTASAVAKWPGAISYVPQDVMISDGSIRDNVALGFPKQQATSELVNRALKIAHLDNFVKDLPLGIDTQVGERGTKLSGGQRQRLGIARAMFTQPLLLVLDEATSSLDVETESNIMRELLEIRGSTTLVIIAHRLSTIVNADTLVYIQNGSIAARGTFDEVRMAVPDFDRQSKLIGL